jgi:PKD domain
MKPLADRTLAARPLLIVVLAVTALVAAGCGGGDDGGGNGKFDVKGTVDHFAGPTPLIVRFDASAKNADGDVIYRWRFDDGTSTNKPKTTHTFKRAGYYQVILDARDESGNNDRESFLFGAWPRQQWATAQTTPLTKEGAKEAQRVQQARTDKRREELRKELRRRAREQIEG